MKKKDTDLKLVSSYLNDNKIATMNQLKTLLGTNSRMTVFRKLTKSGCLSSCSHSGKYYALKKTARFNKYGLWRHESVLFSKHGTLKSTLKAMIGESTAGFTATELKKILKVKVEDTLCILTREKAVKRKKISGVFVYFSANAKAGKKQELTRTNCLRSDAVSMKPESLTDELKAALIIFFSTLDEKQRRLYAGYESLKIGRGGDKMIAEALNIDRKTVARGRRELLGEKVDVDIVRKSGGGRKSTKKNSSM
jgi:hypothetical protein